MLTGPVGVGKTAIVELLAKRIVQKSDGKAFTIKLDDHYYAEGRIIIELDIFQ